MKVKGVGRAVIAALVIASKSSYAQDPSPYIQLNAGVAQGLAPKGDFNKKAMKRSGVYSAEIGSKVNDHFRAGLNVGYRNNFRHKYDYTYVAYGENVNESSKIKINSLAMMANFYYDVDKINAFTPYLTAGVGVALNKTGDHITTMEEGYHSVDGKGSKINFAYKVGGGIRFAINEKLELDLCYQFADLGKFQTGDSHEIYLNGALIKQVTSPKATGRLRAHEILAGLTYKF